MEQHLSLKDAAVAAAVVFAWGINFMFMKLALEELSPMVLGMTRFFCVLLPAVFFFKCPPVRWHWLALYGLTISFGQFSFTFSALSIGMPTGLAALIVQAQAFFTVLLAFWLFREPVRRNHLFGMIIAAAGLLLIGIGQYQGVMPMTGIWLILAAALSWGGGNIVLKQIGRVNPISLVVWGNVSSFLAFLAASLAIYGFDGVYRQISGIGWRGGIGTLYLAYISGLGYVGWGILLSRHPAGKITPLALLVPVIAMIAAFLLIDERLNGWQWLGSAVVMSALLVHIFGARFMRSR